jgi:8-oxo-dGTP diphosphatase
MSDTEKEIHAVYGNKVRVRACGICFSEEGILLVKHQGLGSETGTWLPPGGGIEPGESAEQCVKREILEETGLRADVIEFLFVYEFINPPLHAIELFFHCMIKGGNLKTGNDPELKTGKQIITDVEFVSFANMNKMKPEELHGVFQHGKTRQSILEMRGYRKAKK